MSDLVDAERYSVDLPYSAEDRLIDDQRMIEEGYIQGRHPVLEMLGLSWPMQRGIASNSACRPSSFSCSTTSGGAFYALRPAIAPLVGAPLCALPDFWLWHIDPKSGEAGWTPHVDKGPYALTPDGKPLSLTVWIPAQQGDPA